MSNVNTTDEALAGAAVYNKGTLAIYDYSVLGFSNAFVWKCRTKNILSLYNENITSNHLDIGVGTGYYLDKCKFPVPNPNISLLDLNPTSLQGASIRLKRYTPKLYRADVLQPLPIEEKYKSIGLTYLLHCLPSDISSKAEAVFSNIKPFLEGGGVVFGATILGKGVKKGLLAKRFLETYNSKKIFSNANDDAEGLNKALAKTFAKHSVNVKGCVALFTASN